MAKEKPKFVIVDNTAVIELHTLGRWDKVVAAYKVIVPEHILLEEARRYPVKDNSREELIKLQPAVDAGLISVCAVTKKQAKDMEARLCPELLAGVDKGEHQLLTHFLTDPSLLAVCSGDNIVPQILGYWGHGDRCYSLDEILNLAGWGCKVSDKHAAPMRDGCVARGQRLSVTSPPPKTKP